MDVLGMKFCSAFLHNNDVKKLRTLKIKNTWLVDESRTVFDFITKFIKEHGVLPQIQTILSEVGFSVDIDKWSATEPLEFYADKLRRRHLTLTLAKAIKRVSTNLEQNRAEDAVNELIRTTSLCRELSDDGICLINHDTNREERWEEYCAIEDTDDGVQGVRTPWPIYDSFTGGYRDGDFHIKVARPGTGKCVAKGTLIYNTVTGSYFPIEKFKDECSAPVLTFYEKNEEILPVNAKFWWYTGVKECLEIITYLGYKIQVTPEHPILTKNGYIRADELCVGNVIATTASLPQPTQPQSMSECDMRELVIDCVVTNNHIPREVFNLPNCDLRIFLTMFWQCSRRITTGFTTIKTKSIAKAKDIQQLLLRFNITSKVDKTQVSINKKSRAALKNSIKIIGNYSINEIQKLLALLPKNDSFLHKDILFDEIVSIEDAGEMPVFDLTIPVTHNFIANNIVCHNTFSLCVEAVHAWRNNVEHSGPVVIVETEMSAKALQQRLDAIQYKLPYRDLRRGELDHDQRIIYRNAMHDKTASEKELIIAAEGAVRTVSDIESIIREYNPSIVFVDGIYLLGDTRMREWERTTQASRQLKKIASVTNSKLVATTQFNREASKKKGNQGKLEDLGYADALGQDASTVTSMWQDEDLKAEKIMQLRMLKNRDDQMVEFAIRWDLMKMNFELIQDDRADGGSNKFAY